MKNRFPGLLCALLSAYLCAFSPAASAGGIHLGIPSAVKAKVRQLKTKRDDKLGAEAPASDHRIRLTSSRSYRSTGDGSGRIYYLKSDSASDSVALYRMNADGTGALQLLGGSYSDHYSWDGELVFPSGTKLLVTRITEGSQYLYTLNSDGTGLTRIYTSTREISGEAISPDGLKVAFMESADSGESGTIKVMNNDGTAPLALSLAAERAAPWVPVSFSTDSAKLCFVSTGNVISSIHVDNTALLPLYAPDTVYGVDWETGGKIAFYGYSSATGKQEAALINPDGTGKTVLYSTSALIGAVSLSPDESEAAIFDSLNGLVVINAVTGAVLNMFPLSFAPDSVSWISGTKLDLAGYDLYSTDALSPVLLNLTNNTLPSANRLDDAKGGRLAFSEERVSDTLCVVNYDGSGKRTIKQPGRFSCELSPDASRLLFAAGDLAGSLYVDSGASSILVSTAASWSGLRSWSPSGDKFVYDNPDGFYMANPDGAGKKHMSFTGVTINNPVFSPDESQLAFFGFDTGSGKDIIAVGAASFSTYTTVLATTSSCYLTDWKAGKLFFQSSDGPSWTLNAVDPAGTGLKAIADSFYYKVSPTGLKVLYVDPADALYVVNSDGTGARLLSSDDADGWGWTFNWSPDGSQMIYTNSEKIWIADADGLNAYLYETGSRGYYGDVDILASKKVVYSLWGDLWSGSEAPSAEASFAPARSGSSASVSASGPAAVKQLPLPEQSYRAALQAGKPPAFYRRSRPGRLPPEPARRPAAGRAEGGDGL